MTPTNNTMIESLLKDLSQNSQPMSNIVSTLINVAMKIEQEKFLNVSPYERGENREGQRNGYKDKTVKSRIGELDLKVPQVRNGKGFYPSSIEKGCRSERSLKLAIAQMYIQGVSTRKVTKVVEKLCGFNVSQAQVSEAAKELDEEISKWRNRKLGKFQYMIVDATYENVRIDGAVVKAAILVAFGVDYNGNRTVLGVSCELSEAEIHWRNFFQSLINQGLHGLALIISDAHSGLAAARNAVFPNIPWQRCQFHLQQNASNYVPKVSMRKEVARDIRIIYNAPNRDEANRYLNIVVKKYEESAPKLSTWIEENIPQGLTVFTIPIEHQKQLRTSNMAERQMREIKRRTRVANIFPNVNSLIRLVASILIETDDGWRTGRKYLKDPE